MGRPSRTILYIDDDSDTRFLLRELLAERREMEGEEASIGWLEASSIEEAVDRFGSRQPDAILLDNGLGIVEGVERLPQVRQTWNCPVWILTGLSTDSLERRCASYGGAGLVLKDDLVENPSRLLSLFR